MEKIRNGFDDNGKTTQEKKIWNCFKKSFLNLRLLTAYNTVKYQNHKDIRLQIGERDATDGDTATKNRREHDDDASVGQLGENRRVGWRSARMSRGGRRNCVEQPRRDEEINAVEDDWRPDKRWLFVESLLLLKVDRAVRVNRC